MVNEQHIEQKVLLKDGDIINILNKRFKWVDERKSKGKKNEGNLISCLKLKQFFYLLIFHTIQHYIHYAKNGAQYFKDTDLKNLVKTFCQKQLNFPCLF